MIEALSLLRAASVRTAGPAVILPLDVPARELDSKLVIASALAREGMTVVLGHKSLMRHVAVNSGPVVWQGKGLFSGNAYSLQDVVADRLIEKGSAIVYDQDEGAMFQVRSWEGQVIQKHQLDAMRSRRVARVCGWGRRQAQVIADYAPELAGSVRVTGSARFDLCGRAFDWIDAASVREIRGRFGDYILACTRFGSVANAGGMHQWFRRKQNTTKEVVDQSLKDAWFSKWHRDIHDLGDFTLLIRRLADVYPQRKIVLRPHPSESLEFYTEAFASFTNVEVIREGSVLNWIRAADLVVHSNCTTGVEAVLAGAAVLSYLPGGDARQDADDVEVAREAGTVARTLEAALRSAGDLLAGRADEVRWSPRSLNALNNLTREAIPLLVAETAAAARENGIDSARIALPRVGFRETVRRKLAERADPTQLMASRRAPIDRTHVEQILDGCRSMGIGAGRVRIANSSYLIIEPG